MTRNSNDELYAASLYVWHETAKAYLCTESPGQDKDRDGFWMPKSQLRNMERSGNILNCDVPAWLAEEKGIDLGVDPNFSSVE